MPAWGGIPDAMAKAMARGNATRPTVTPAIRSAAKSRVVYPRNVSRSLGVQGLKSSIGHRLRFDLIQHRLSFGELGVEIAAHHVQDFVNQAVAHRIENLVACLAI